MPNPTCQRWQALFKDKNNRGQIYNDFLVDRYVLTDHLDNCQSCQNLTVAIKANVDMIPNNSMTDEEFSLAIRELYRLYKEKNP